MYGIRMYCKEMSMSWLWDKLMYGGGSRSGSGDFFPSPHPFPPPSSPVEGGEEKDQMP